MHPAFSVLLFTVTSGFGYGFMIILVMAQLFGGNPFAAPQAYWLSFAVALLLMTVGLLASTFHLANPKNAWRAFSRFRTSWLSREGVLALLYYPLALIYIFVLWRNSWQTSPVVLLTGVLCIVIAGLLLLCTAMIYASLKTIPQWHTRLVPAGFLIFAVLSGLLLFNLALTSAGQAVAKGWLWGTVALSVLAAVFKWYYFAFVGKPSRSNINTATSFTEARVRLLDTGHSAPNFLQKEFIYEVGPKTKTLARRLVLLMAFAMPALLLFAQMNLAGGGLPLALLAVVSAYLGLLLERWLFFVEARHVIRHYYGA